MSGEIINRLLQDLFLHDGVPERMRGRHDYFSHKSPPQNSTELITRKPYTVVEYDKDGRATFRDPTPEENPDFYK